MVAPFYILTSKGWGVLVSSYPHQYFVFLNIIILVSMKWYLIVDSICIYLIITDIKQVFMCLLVICISSLEKCLLISFKVEPFIFFIIEMKNSLYILDASLLSPTWFTNTFFHLVGYFYTFLTVSLAAQELFLMKSNSSTYFFLLLLAPLVFSLKRHYPT